tara:strand:+ start:1052 stop:1297 length:246 start_codon:yes stop_codon:yes gene_type:complete
MVDQEVEDIEILLQLTVLVNTLQVVVLPLVAIKELLVVLLKEPVVLKVEVVAVVPAQEERFPIQEVKVARVDLEEELLLRS